MLTKFYKLENPQRIPKKKVRNPKKIVKSQKYTTLRAVCFKSLMLKFGKQNQLFFKNYKNISGNFEILLEKNPRSPGFGIPTKNPSESHLCFWLLKSKIRNIKPGLIAFASLRFYLNF